MSNQTPLLNLTPKQTVPIAAVVVFCAGFDDDLYPIPQIWLKCLLIQFMVISIKEVS